MDVWLLNQAPMEGSEQIEITIQNQDGATISRQSLPFRNSAGLTRLDRFRVEAVEKPGCYHILTRLVRAQAVLAERIETIHCLPKAQWENNTTKIYLPGSTPPLFQSEDFRECWGEPISAAQDSQAILVGLPGELSVEGWAEMLGLARSGFSVVIGALSPENEIACETLLRAGIPVELHPGFGSWMGCHHWLPAGELTECLPTAGGLAGEAFADILPRYVLAELGGDVLAGSMRCSQERESPKEIQWRSDIEKISFGNGRLFFCQYRLFEQAHTHPVASRMAYNLVRMAARPSREMSSISQ
jgi:hypothetical protein